MDQSISPEKLANVPTNWRFELPTQWLRNTFGKAISSILLHGWQRYVTEKHVRNAQVVPILYSRNWSAA
jgi:hypothetical protein